MAVSNKICWKTGKYVKKSERTAVAQLDSIRRLQPEYSGRPYVCPFCKGWHVGRAGKKWKR